MKLARIAAAPCRSAALLSCALCGSAAATNVRYYGGPVLSNTEIVMVNWGPSVSATVTNGLPLFYADVVRSNYWTVLLQYSTAGVLAEDGLPGSNQTIGMGSFAGQYTITPTLCPAAGNCTVTTVQVAAELAAQLDAHNLPQPSFDAQGLPKTLYMVHFPSGVRIQRNTNYSCVQFCATSENFDYGTSKLSAVVIPDLTNAGCSGGGCGTGTLLQNTTAVSSYELGALTSTPLAASAATLARPLAWYDPVSGQARISDKCAGNTASIVVNGNNWRVAQWWSNAVPGCAFTTAKLVVVPSATAGGGISPALPQAVDANATPSFTVTADPGFVVAVGGTCGGQLVGSTYTTAPVSADCTVQATFLSNVVFASSFENIPP